MEISYILPLRAAEPASKAFDRYIDWLSRRVELIVVDGSDADVFTAHARRWAPSSVLHLSVDPDLRPMLNGKVAGVMTGVRRATHDLIVIADDDVRYDDGALARMESALLRADVVRPQNYFESLPWHAWIDTGRTLLNRMTGGDWPGTLGVRRSILETTHGYDGDVMFENLALVRTVVAAGGRESCPLDLYVARLPPSGRHFWSQRVRQAYDEFARPARLAVWLSVLPVVIALAVVRRWSWLALGAAAIVALAELGRRRAHGTRVFPFAAALAAPVWLCERAVCAWIAVGARIALGGIPYRGRVIERAA